MKHIFCTVSVVLLLAGGLFAGTYSGGDGIFGDPYQIATTDDLIELSNTSADWDDYFIQTADISFNADETLVDWDGVGGADGSGTSGFAPIGNSTTGFTGSYDGNAKTISNLFINRPSTTKVGLFGYVYNNTIDNLGLMNVDITGNENVGALIGDINTGSVSNCYSTGSISGSSYVGGLIGYAAYISLSDSYSSCTVTGTQDDIGGLVGINMLGDITRSYSTGNVSGDTNVGGFVGNNYQSATVSNSYSTGNVTRNSGSTNTSFGGFCGGHAFSTLEYCYSTGDVFESPGTAWSTDDKGFVGYEYDGNYSDNFFDTSSNQSSATGATGLSEAEMQVQSNFTNWDFTSTWDMDQSGTFNDGYPFLSWQNGTDTSLPVAPSGSGTSEDPYLIANLGNLNWLSQSSGEWGKYYKQIADIDASGTSTWDGGAGFSPIGNNSTSFKGEYDGGGYTIDNLYINRSGTSGIGLFGVVSEATITDIGVTNVNITGDNYVGGLVGLNYSNSIVSNSYSTGNVSGGEQVGGLVGYGYISSNVNNSYSTCSVSGSTDVGGLVGMNYGDSPNSIVSNSYSTGSVTSTTGNVGGLVGYNVGSPVSNSYSTGSVTGTGNVGGLVGDNEDESTVSNSFWDTVTSEQDSSAGGTGKTTAQMKSLATFTDVSTTGLDAAWDFETNPNDDMGNNDYWDIDNTESTNSGYPFLAWQNGTDTSLPVELASFTGEYSESSIQLTWVTESEIRNQGFLLECRTSPKAAWEEIVSFKTNAALRGQGSTSKRSVYTFTDQTVKAGEEYSYRLTDVSFEGKVKVHNDFVLPVVAVPTTPSVFRVQTPYPNPFNPTTTIAYSLPAEAPVRIAVYNITGQLVSVVFHQTQPAGNHQMSLSLPDYASGAYFMRISTPDHKQTRKLLLMK
ncbi:MAG: T9SS type A sorting domain-containing protein [Candidatus Marinimicrobia bacterium]|nr:T9SS type A sorting domain-containing protein [Candidatus Neomarinimicrobiota bacterium]MCF7829342.1 T9SS type A sorting domain-containing protein [Candidatus Neomarinimicrobiota bacterium]MCF7879996.1 T9SS type A sorting domain-containing protein [Candidatus Neomarinimicrobiota bacterium]